MLEVSFLGTDPPTMAVDTSTFVKRDYAALNSEYYDI
jgi:hypothetical protein